MLRYKFYEIFLMIMPLIYNLYLYYSRKQTTCKVILYGLLLSLAVPRPVVILRERMDPPRGSC